MTELTEIEELANSRAIEYNHEYVGTEHILLVLLELSEVDDALKEQGIDSKEVKSELEKISLKGPDRVITGKIPITPRTKKSLEYACEIAKENERETPNALDVLDGLFKESECIANQVLNNFGYKTIPEKITPESVLLRGGFRIKDNRAYRKKDGEYIVVKLDIETPVIVYHSRPELIEDALEAKKLLQKYHFSYSETPTLNEVVKSLEYDIIERTSLIERILENE